MEKRPSVGWLLVAAMFLSLSACGKSDPFDEAFIKKDLKKRSAQDLWDASEKFKFDPPLHRRITDGQIADFVRAAKLGTRIRSIAEHDMKEQVDRANAAGDRFTRLGESFAAVGAARSYATADLRACLNLGINPKEMQWVGQQINSTFLLIARVRSLDDGIAAKKRDLDAEIDPLIAERKTTAYNNAVKERENWESTQDPAIVANMQLVLRHREELKEIFPELGR